MALIHQVRIDRRPWRQLCWGLLLLAGVWLAWAGTAHAQPSGPAPVVTVSRSWYFEAALVVGMFGLALFVVCRSSRRN